MNTDQESCRAKTAPIENWLVGLCAAGTILLIWWLLRYSAYGIDFTDESFYLVWIANPFIYDGSITQFGFVYHPLYILLNGDIAALRQANILITFALAWSLTYVFLGSLATHLKESRTTLLTVSAAFATTALFLFVSWLPTPSYNSLSLQALLVTATGLVLAEKTAHGISIFGWMLIGIGGWLTLMAKPTTAAALAVGVLIYLLLARKFSIRLLLLSGICALVLIVVSALAIDGSVIAFTKRLILGAELAEFLGAGHTLSNILRIDNFQLDKGLKLAIFCLSGALFLALWSICEKNRKWRVFGLLISIVFFMLTALQTTGGSHRTADFGQFQGLLVFGLVYAMAIAAVAIGHLRVLRNIPAQQWAIAALFLAMPHIYAFGTISNYWQTGSSAAVFWLLAGLTLLAPLVRERASWFLTLPVALAAQAVTAILLQTGLEQPYRQPQPLRLNASTLAIGPQRAPLVLSEGYAEYLASTMNVAEKAQFHPDTPLIDLTGQSPGILYALGARSIGQAWMIGGYPGSLTLAKAVLGRTSCEEIAAAWILFEKDGPRSIPIELMASLGADFPNDYRSVGTWNTASGAGGYTEPRTQDLYEPLEQKKTLMSCLKLSEKTTQ